MKTLIIFVKYPQTGKVKTRLGKSVGYEEAAGLYRIFLEQTFELAAASKADRVSLAVDPAGEIDFFRNIAPNAFHCFPQSEGDLGTRLTMAFKTALAAPSKKAVAIGSDSPTLPVSFINDAFMTLSTKDVVLGPATDGGYYLIGMKQLLKPMFENIPWSTKSVFEASLRQAENHHIPYSVLPEWYDVDDATTLRRASQDDASGKIRAFMEKRIRAIE